MVYLPQIGFTHFYSPRKNNCIYNVLHIDLPYTADSFDFSIRCSPKTEKTAFYTDEMEYLNNLFFVYRTFIN